MTLVLQELWPGDKQKSRKRTLSKAIQQRVERFDGRLMMVVDLQGFWGAALNEAKLGETIELSRVQVGSASDMQAGQSYGELYSFRDAIGLQGEIHRQFADGGFSYPQPSIDVYSFGPMFYLSLRLLTSPPNRFVRGTFLIVMESDAVEGRFESLG